jgi:hypothetical protein
MVDKAVPLEVIMKGKYLAVNIAQVLYSDVLFKVQVGDLNSVHFGKERVLSIGVCTVLLVQEDTFQSFHETGVLAWEDEGKI